MKTEELFYQYPNNGRFKARVIKILSPQELMQGDLKELVLSLLDEKTKYIFGIILDRTLCYPEGWGQPGDRGVLEGENITVELITTLRSKFHAEIVHLTDGEISVGCEIEGQIDKSYRQDYQQQHSGGHILSAVLYRTMGISTSAMHFGQKESTINIDSLNFSQFDLKLLEEECNSLCQKNLEVTSQIIPKGEFNSSSLQRKCPVDKNSPRVVSIGSYDIIPCGGVHCQQTAQIAPIFILKLEKIQSGQRIHFITGDRARFSYHSQRESLEKIAQTLSCPINEIDHILRIIRSAK